MLNNNAARKAFEALEFGTKLCILTKMIENVKNRSITRLGPFVPTALKSFALASETKIIWVR